MKCKSARKVLTDYVDGLLDTEDAQAVEKHLAVCDDCRREADMLRKVLNLLGKAKVEYPPAPVWDSFIPDLHRRIEREAALIFWKQQKQRVYFLPGWVSSAIALILLVVVSVMLWRYPSESPVLIQRPDNTAVTETASDTAAAVRAISDVLLTESEAVELGKLKDYSEQEPPVHLYYEGSEYGDMSGGKDSETGDTSDKGDVVQLLMENAFVDLPIEEFDDYELTKL